MISWSRIGSTRSVHGLEFWAIPSSNFDCFHLNMSFYRGFRAGSVPHQGVLASEVPGPSQNPEPWVLAVYHRQWPLTLFLNLRCPWRKHHPKTWFRSANPKSFPKIRGGSCPRLAWFEVVQRAKAILQSRLRWDTKMPTSLEISDLSSHPSKGYSPGFQTGYVRWIIIHSMYLIYIYIHSMYVYINVYIQYVSI